MGEGGHPAENVGHNMLISDVKFVKIETTPPTSSRPGSTPRASTHCACTRHGVSTVTVFRLPWPLCKYRASLDTCGLKCGRSKEEGQSNTPESSCVPCA